MEHKLLTLVALKIDSQNLHLKILLQNILWRTDEKLLGTNTTDNQVVMSYVALVLTACFDCSLFR